ITPNGFLTDLPDAMQSMARDIEAGTLRVGEISEKTIGRYLYDPGMPDVDLFLRPSGEKRTSNFLLWQSAYAEMVYQDKLFPDFTPQDLYDAVAEYARRDRRFGGTK
ncbi:undecaprenyl diphosphate synthase family protein, partial [Corynebacterium pseudodiphtheriticum]|uniref:undecaprenyl diphosphate synthase family protein n=1 Tax=Corynebacterium pseudodiphtheriticum TaxID=37637 RepID=UPI002542A2DF